jgi:hypothetical protein
LARPSGVLRSPPAFAARWLNFSLNVRISPT